MTDDLENTVTDLRVEVAATRESLEWIRNNMVYTFDIDTRLSNILTGQTEYYRRVIRIVMLMAVGFGVVAILNALLLLMTLL